MVCQADAAEGVPTGPQAEGYRQQTFAQPAAQLAGKVNWLRRLCLVAVILRIRQRLRAPGHTNSVLVLASWRFVWREGLALL